MKFNSAQLTSSIKKWCAEPIVWNSEKKFAKFLRKLLKTAKLKNIRKKIGRMIDTVPEIVQAKKSQSRCNLTDFSAAPKRPLILTDVGVCYFMLRIVVNRIGNDSHHRHFRCLF